MTTQQTQMNNTDKNQQTPISLEQEALQMIQPVETLPQPPSEEPPATRAVIEKLKDLGMLGVGGLAAIPQGLGKLNVNQKVKDIQ